VVDKTGIGIRAAISIIPRSDPDYDSKRNQMISHNSVHAERLEEGGPIRMVLNDAARDRLTFYGRQDGAHALLNTIDLLRKINLANRLLMVLIALVVVLICGVFHIRPW
jgi:hypothetical protein